MMRSLYTAATGMLAQQTNVDNISNNLANVNTIGYKQEKTEFKSLLYQTIQTKKRNLFCMMQIRLSPSAEPSKNK